MGNSASSTSTTKATVVDDENTPAPPSPIPTEEDPLLVATTVSEEASSQQHRKTRSVDFAVTQEEEHAHRRTRSNRFGGMGARSGGKARHQSESALTESLRNLGIALEPIAEDMMVSMRNIQAAFVEELDTLDQGDTGFLDMSMNRSIAVVPEDLPDLGQEVGLAPKVESPEDMGPPVIQYAALLSAVVAISSNATALHLLEGVPSLLKLFWRMTASYLVLLPFALKSFYRDGIPDLSFGNKVTFVAAVACYSVQAMCFIRALDYTSIGNALIFANSQALLLIIGKGFVGEAIHWMEALGVVIAFSGAILCSFEEEASSSASNSSSDSNEGLVGDVLALAASIMGVGYLTFAKAVRSQMQITVFLFSVMFLGSFLLLGYMMLDSSIELEFSADPDHGVIGWINMEEFRLPILIYLAIVVNCVGTLGFVRAMAYFDNVIIAVATLLEPMLASFIAHAFHVGELPGPLGWCGNLLVAIGTLNVIYPSLDNKEKTMH